MRIFLGMGLFVTHVVFAESTDTNHHPAHSMNTIVVTASAKKENIHEAMASIDVIDGKQLNQRFINDVSDALNDRVGLQNVGIGLNRKGVSIRGMNPTHTLYLVDGQRINSSSSAIAHSDGELNWVPTEAIEQIEVVRGPMSSLYGSEALGGVVNIITRKPIEKWTGSASIQSLWNESNLGGDQYKTSAYLSGPLIENKLGVNFWAEFRKRDALEDPTNSRLSKHDEQKNTKGHLGLFWQATDQQQIEFISEYGHEDRQDLRGGTRNQYYQVDDEIERARFGLKHEGEWGWGKSIVKLYQTQFKRESERSDGGDTTSPQKLTDQVASTQFQFDLSNHHLILGNELRKEKLEDPTVNLKQKDSITHYGIYLQDIWQISDQFKVGFGARGDEHSDFGWELSPKFNASYQLSDAWTVKAGVGKGYKAPTLKQLSKEFESNAAMGGMGIIRGNPDLKPETNTAYEVGLHFHRDNFETSLGWFRNNVDDLIDTQRQPTCSVAGKICLDYVNVTKAELQGIEWSGAYHIEPYLHLEANYTYLDAKDKSKNIPLADRSKHQLNSSVIWQVNDKLQTKLRQQYRSKQFQAANTPHSQGYIFWHMYADYKVTPNWTVQTGIENLTDKKIGMQPDQLQTFSDAGRRYFVGMNVRF
ncbi:TonB-dependent receptor plug domain-containing protein [Acinetobacter sp. DSM 11652]|uniref:TonB-dependent receptor plug domain-containing protein n=1 Tax=Acinetobacter sp. DSM 11652 TaxID=346222 RepID=UPI0008BD00E3|nr:TonB-dependent receptor [Acinetobacter sp. DSM 11652]SEM33255.1 outer membrane receptor for ferrienterochelin and colicins [Acinetobacter sp. DSM 11652]